MLTCQRRGFDLCSLQLVKMQLAGPTTHCSRKAAQQASLSSQHAGRATLRVMGATLADVWLVLTPAKEVRAFVKKG